MSEQQAALVKGKPGSGAEDMMPMGDDVRPKLQADQRKLAAGAAAALVLVVLIVAVSVASGGGDASGAGSSAQAGEAAAEIVYYLGDPQIGMGKLGADMDQARFEAAARSADGATAVVVAGDVVNQWDNQDWIDKATAVLALFDAPRGVHLLRGVHVVPGNHDVNPHAATAAEFREQLQHYRDNFGPDYHSFTTTHATFVMVNSESLIADEDHPEVGSGVIHPALATRACPGISHHHLIWFRLRACL